MNELKKEKERDVERGELWFFEHQYSWNTKFQTGNISLREMPWWVKDVFTPAYVSLGVNSLWQLT